MGGGLESGTQNGRALSGWPERVLLGVGLVLVAAGLSWAAFAPPAAPRPGGGVEPAERPDPGAVTPTALPQVGGPPR